MFPRSALAGLDPVAVEVLGDCAERLARLPEIQDQPDSLNLLGLHDETSAQAAITVGCNTNLQPTGLTQCVAWPTVV